MTREADAAGAAERAYRAQLHAIVWLLEDGRVEEAIAVACEGPWRAEARG